MSERPRIFVSQPIRPEGLRLLEAVGEVEMVDTDRMLSRDELSAALRRSDYVFAIGDWGIDNELLAENRHLKGIACAYDDPWVWFDLPFVSSLGIPITGLSISTFIDSTADLTMALLLALAWRFRKPIAIRAVAGSARSSRCSSRARRCRGRRWAWSGLVT